MHFVLRPPLGQSGLALFGAATTIIVADGEEDTVIYAITRGNIELKDSQASGQVLRQDERKDRPLRKIGWLKVPSVYLDLEGARAGLVDFRSASRDTRRLLQSFREEGVDVVVLDLRSATGESLTEAINLAGLFIDHGPIIQVKDANGSVQQYEDMEHGSAWEGPLPSLTSEMDIGEEHLEYAIPFDTVAASSYSKLDMTKDEVLAQLKENSLSRIADSPDFQNVAKSIGRYRARKARQSVTLNERQFIEQRRQDQLAKQDEAQEDELEVPGPAYYVREVIQIALDYVAALEK